MPFNSSKDISIFFAKGSRYLFALPINKLFSYITNGTFKIAAAIQIGKVE